MSITLGIKVDYEAYQYYRKRMAGEDKERIREILRKTFAQLVEEVRKKGEVAPEGKREEIEVRVTQTLEVSESEALKLYRRITHLEKELNRALSNLIETKEQLEQTKEQLEKERTEREKCLKELDAAKKRPELLEKELTQLRQSHSNLLELASLVVYCFDTGECNYAKLNSLLKSRLSRLGVQPTKPNEFLLSLVTPK